MNALLDEILAANGGTERWNAVTTITAEVTFGGPFWEFKGQPDFASTELVEASARGEFIRQTDVNTGRTVVFDKARDLVTVTDADGTVIDDLKHPRDTFDGYTTSSAWSVAQMAYFRSYATWHYLVEPFVFAFPGVITREIEASSRGRRDLARTQRHLRRRPRHPQPDAVLLLQRRRPPASHGLPARGERLLADRALRPGRDRRRRGHRADQAPGHTSGTRTAPQTCHGFRSPSISPTSASTEPP